MPTHESKINDVPDCKFRESVKVAAIISSSPPTRSEVNKNPRNPFIRLIRDADKKGQGDFYLAMLNHPGTGVPHIFIVLSPRFARLRTDGSLENQKKIHEIHSSA